MKNTGDNIRMKIDICTSIVEMFSETPYGSIMPNLDDRV